MDGGRFPWPSLSEGGPRPVWTAQGFEVDRRKIQLAEAIKAVGEFNVPVRLHRDVTAQIKVLVAAEGAPEAPPAEA